MTIISVGNLAIGFHFIGPFETYKKALDWAVKNDGYLDGDWSFINLANPEKFVELMKEKERETL